MRYSIAAIAFAGAAVALPSKIARDVVNDVQVVQEVQWVTDVVTVQGPAPTPTPSAAPVVHVQAAPVEQPTSFVVKVVTQEAAAPADPSPAPASTTPAPASAPAPSSSAAAPSSSSSSSSDSSTDSQAMLAVVNKWRKIFGHPEMTWDDQLASNALKTGTDDSGVNENHELNGDSMAQVITPGVASCSGTKTSCDGLSSGFEMAYLAGWMCEAPNSVLAPLCGKYTSAAGMDLSSGETGHADILNNGDYKKIGCAFANNPSIKGNMKATSQWTGLWICDLGL